MAKLAEHLPKETRVPSLVLNKPGGAVIPALRRWKLQVQKFKIILS